MSDSTNQKIKILLLTNRDSDNVGDQVIEACDISLISGVMKNLGYTRKQYKIISRAASLVSQKYMATKNPALLETAERLMQKADIVIFGGAPLFNFLYQPFYERTAITLELAKKYNKPVLFSAIGVEGYGETNEKCQRLKKALNLDCVKQITTRDDFDALQNYKSREDLIIDKVADPAVFTASVFRNFANQETHEKTIGLFVIRSNGFVDNHFDFTKDDSAALWVNLVKELEQKGYNYELLTSGHFGDEAFLDYLIRNHNIPAKRCVFNMNTPEKLIQKISSYDGVISCRLHPSIISFSLDVPSVGLVWNNKVTEFYNSMGYPERVVTVEQLTPTTVMETLEKAMSQGIKKDTAYLASVYRTLFYGIKNILCPENEVTTPYGYDELLTNIPAYKGTSPEELEKKLERKFRRTYKTYNERCEKTSKKSDVQTVATTTAKGLRQKIKNWF